MTNKSGNIGTATETAVVRVLLRNGWPSAERRRLRGRYDCGDITGTPGICWEVKGGNMARTASDKDIEDWLAEAEVERANARADVAVLVVQRKGVGAPNAGRWWAILRHDVMVPGSPHTFPIRLTLDDVCAWLNVQGYGTPQEATA